MLFQLPALLKNANGFLRADIGAGCHRVDTLHDLIIVHLEAFSLWQSHS